MNRPNQRHFMKSGVDNKSVTLILILAPGLAAISRPGNAVAAAVRFQHPSGQLMNIGGVGVEML